MSLFKNSVSDLVESVNKARVSLPTGTAKAKEGCLKLYYAIINYFMKGYTADDNNTTVDAKIQTFKQ